jgi:hypothetical protein
MRVLETATSEFELSNVWQVRHVYLNQYVTGALVVFSALITACFFVERFKTNKKKSC